MLPGTLTVTPCSIQIGNDSQTYGTPVDLATDLGPTIAGVNGETLGITYTSDGDTATANAGTYDINGTLSDITGLASNYKLIPGTLTVIPATLTITALPQSIGNGSPLTQPTTANYGTVWTASGWQNSDAAISLTGCPRSRRLIHRWGCMPMVSSSPAPLMQITTSVTWQVI